MSLTQKEFQALQAFWYNRLREEGFEDIERTTCHYMRRETHNIALRYNSDTEEHYRRCRSLEHTPAFQDLSTLDQCVWGLYSEGFSYDQILTHLNKTNNLTMLCRRKAYSRTKIQKIIQRIKELL